MGWLNQYASAIQAITAVLSLIVAAILVWATSRYVALTGRYVELTRLILETSQTQVKQQHHHYLEKIPRLLGLIRPIQKVLDQLPYTKSDAPSLLTVPMWTEEDLRLYQQVASEVSGSAGLIAADSLISLRWIRMQVAAITSTNPNLDVDWSKFPWDRWGPELLQAHKLTNQVWRAVHEIAAVWMQGVKSEVAD
jgi:hypothetical protein